LPSGFDRSLVLTIDAFGDGASGMILSGEGPALKSLSVLPDSKSLGRFYLGVIRFLGYDLFDEYKVMGLAPYGDPQKYRKMFKKFYTLLPDGDYIIHMDNLHRLFGLAAPRRTDDHIEQLHKDIAAALQESLEAIVLHVLRHYRDTTGHSKLCLAGGVAHNCTLNGKILYSGLFDDVFVQPASHDAGGAVGAALLLCQQRNGLAGSKAWNHVYWGTKVGDGDEVLGSLWKWKDLIEIEKLENVEERAARLLAEGYVIGWVQGRSEFGPRALGNRSILADPRPAENRDIINSMVKKREAFRPFAPSVLEEYVDDFFVVPENKKNFPFMVFVLKVREDKQKLLGAITHLDGTARVQTVSKAANPRYWGLIEEFRKLTAVPVLLNTSFNNNAEPIVDSVDDAVVCYLTTRLHYLVVGDYLISKKEGTDRKYARLAPSLPAYAILRQVRKHSSPGEMRTSYEIGNSYNDRYRAQISSEAFSILSQADGDRSLDELLAKVCPANENKRETLQELLDLWSRRVISLSPRIKTN
jgi:carbamoyltransferase